MQSVVIWPSRPRKRQADLATFDSEPMSVSCRGYLAPSILGTCCPFFVPTSSTPPAAPFSASCRHRPHPLICMDSLIRRPGPRTRVLGSAVAQMTGHAGDERSQRDGDKKSSTETCHERTTCVWDKDAKSRSLSTDRQTLGGMSNETRRDSSSLP